MKSTVMGWIFSLSGALRRKWRTLPPGLYCFNYHRVGNAERCSTDRGVFSCTEQTFVQQIQLLQQRFHLVTIDELLELGESEKPVSRELGLITFDDGYIDNYQIAYPILKRMNVPAVFFLPTDFIGTSKIPWWDEIAWLIRQSKKDEMSVPGLELPISIDRNRIEQSIRQVLRLAKNGIGGTIDTFLAGLRKSCSECDAPTPQTRLFVNWDEVREMVRGGMSVGSHTRSHPVLSHLSEAQQRSELFQSRAAIEEQIGQDVIAISYPVGGRSSFTERTCQIARECGYRLGFTFLSGRNPLPLSLSNAFQLTRFAIDGNANTRQVKLALSFPEYRW